MPIVLSLVSLGVVIWLIVSVQGLRTELHATKDRLGRLEDRIDRRQ
jgi:hypothetical protein